MKTLWSKKARALTPYVAGEQPKLDNIVKLNTNENAYPPSPKVFEAIHAVRALQKYPPPDADAFRAAAAAFCGVGERNVFCANGSDEALALCFQAFFDPDEPVACPEVTYSFYRVCAQLYDIPLYSVPLKADWTIDVQAMCGCRNAVFANPNAPTGCVMSLEEIEQIARSTPGVVIVDEAYIAFGGKTALPLLDRHENIVIVRTLSKSHALAGMRAGYVVAHEQLICALQTVKDSFNSYPIDSVAQAAAAAALADRAYYEKTAGKIVATRERTVRALTEMGAEVLPSGANFIFVRCADAKKTFLQLRERGIIVRYFDSVLTRDFLRVTIGTDEQMERFLAAFQEINGR